MSSSDVKSTEDTSSKFDYKNDEHPNESWDQFIIRKLKEKREYYENRKDLGKH